MNAMSLMLLVCEIVKKVPWCSMLYSGPSWESFICCYNLLWPFGPRLSLLYDANK